MSMSTHVDGFVPPDEKWNKMLAIPDSYVTSAVRMYYLETLAEVHGVELERVLKAAEELGISADFDGLVGAVKEMANEAKTGNG